MVNGRVHPIRCINRRVLGCLARLPWDSIHIVCQTVYEKICHNKSEFGR